MNLLPLLLALQNATAPPASGAKPATPPSMLENPLILIPIFLFIFYFIASRPQARERRVRVQMLKSRKKGARLLMNSGLHGTVAALSEREVFLKVDDKNPLRMRFTRDSILRVVQNEEAPEPEAEGE